MVKPYSDKSLAKGIIRRVFNEAVDVDELVWHQDHNTRKVTVIEGQGWQLQIDNSLPKTLSKGDTVVIEAEQYHRIIKGNTNLVFDINESNN